MNAYLTVGVSALVGAALLEVALAPAALLGGAALLAPVVLPKLRSGVRQALDAVGARPTHTRFSARGRPRMVARPMVPAKFEVKQALAKTITFRVIVTSLDFTTNYLVLGELAVAAGLSSFSLVAGPVFYFVHEASWNYLGPPAGASVELPVVRQDKSVSPTVVPRIVISRALAKTVTFRTIATVMDFTTNFVVIGDLATAAGLSAFGLVLGPFVYLGHEAAWDYFTLAKHDPATPYAPTS